MCLFDHSPWNINIWDKLLHHDSCSYIRDYENFQTWTAHCNYHESAIIFRSKETEGPFKINQLNAEGAIFLASKMDAARLHYPDLVYSVLHGSGENALYVQQSSFLHKQSLFQIDMLVFTPVQKCIWTFISIAW